MLFIKIWYLWRLFAILDTFWLFGHFLASFGFFLGANLKMIEALLATYIEKEEHQVRHVAVQYAGEVFPPSHTPSKFVLLLGAGDSKDEVANEAKLHLYGPINKAHDQKSSRMQAVKSEDEAMQQQLLLLPDFCEMTSVIIDKVPFIYYISTCIEQNLI